MINVSYEKSMELRKLFGFSIMSKEQFEHGEHMDQKFDEYIAHFGDLFCLEGLTMSDEELVKAIDLCIKYNRKFEGFIVPEIDYSENDI